MRICLIGRSALIGGQRVGQRPQARRVRRLDQNHVAGLQFGAQQRQGGVGVGDADGSSISAPHEPSMTAPWCMALIDLPVPTTTSRDTSKRTASRPMRSCSVIASSPSSAISPSTAQLRRWLVGAAWAIQASACSPARIESGLAL